MLPYPSFWGAVFNNKITIEMGTGDTIELPYPSFWGAVFNNKVLRTKGVKTPLPYPSFWGAVFNKMIQLRSLAHL